MAGLDFLHNNFALEQNTRLSRLFSGANDDQYASFDRFFGQVSNDPFAQVQGLEFDTARFRTENSFQSLQNDFDTVHNKILNIEQQQAPMLYMDELYKAVIDQNFTPMGEPAIVDQMTYFDTATGEKDFALDQNFTPMDEPAIVDQMTYFDAATGETVSYTDIGNAKSEFTPDIAPNYASEVKSDIASGIAPEITPVLASEDIFTIKSEAIQEITIAQDMDFIYDYKQAVMDNLLQDMNVGSWENMVLHNPADLDYALANNDPLNNVLSEEIIMNDDSYSGLHSDLQNLTSY